MTIKQQGGVFGRNPTFNDVEVDGELTLNGSVVPDPTNIAKLDTANVFTETLTVSGAKFVDSIWTGPSSAGVGGAFRAIQNDGAALANGDRIGSLAYGGSYDGAGNIGFNAVIGAYASENWTASARGTDVIIQTTNNGTTARNNRLIVRNDGTVEISRNLKITVAGYGIDFSATSGTGTSELFDDYEEGTWTPVDASATLGAPLAFAVGNYSKIGRMLFASFMITYPASANTNTASIGGLPFSSMAGNQTGGSAITYTNFGSFISVLNGAGGATMLFCDASAAFLTNANMSGKTVRGTVSYMTA